MSDPRPPGRPRSGAATDAILSASAELLADVGVEGFTIREVVARSGASSATVYRRWPTKPQLLLDTARHLMQQAIPEPDHSSVEHDVREIVGSLVALLRDGPVGSALPQLLRAASSDPTTAVAIQRWMAGRRAVVQRVLELAAARGEVRADLPVAHGAEMLSGVVYYRFLVTGEPVDDAFVDRHVAEFLVWARAGLSPGSPRP